MRISKWGNSLAVRLPVSVVKELALKEGDEIELTRVGDNALAVSRRADRETAIEQLREFRGLLPADFKFDRDEANAR